jgi:hypothetical protein
MNAIKNYFGEVWLKVVLFGAFPIFYLFSRGWFRVIMAVITFGAYYVMFGAGVYEDIKDELAGNTINAALNYAMKK